ncbi:MAG: thiamine diphosphokinase, partial [Bdellovibrionota bacterium]
MKQRKRPSNRIALVVGSHILDARKFSARLKALKKEAKVAKIACIGVDRGLAHLYRAGWVAHFALGDWDSLTTQEQGLLDLVEHETYSPDKVESDLALGLQFVEDIGANRIVVMGATGLHGKRPDHQLSTILEVTEFVWRNPSIRVVEARDDEGRWIWVRGGARGFSETVKKRGLVSIFSLGSADTRVTIKGLKFKVKSQTLDFHSHGLSNEGLGIGATISCTKG